MRDGLKGSFSINNDDVGVSMQGKTYTKNQIIELEISDLGTEGEGLGKLDGFPFFVKGAVPGDVIRASVLKVKKNLGYARLQEVLKASVDRRIPDCPVYGRCGGCQLMHMKYEAQLRYKEKKVYDSLHRIGGIADETLKKVMEPIIGMEELCCVCDGMIKGPGSCQDEQTRSSVIGTVRSDPVPLRYRNKAQYPFGRDREGNIVCGFYAGRTHSIIPQTDCLLGHPVNAEVIEHILDWMKEFDLDPYDEVSGKGLVRHALIRRGYHTGEIMVCLVINAKELPHREELCQRLLQIPGMRSISCSTNRKNTNVIMGDMYRVIWGEATIEDEIGRTLETAAEDPATGTVKGRWDRQEEGALRFKISPLSFYQINSVQTERLYSTALEFAGLNGKETVWDLYCGIGTISLFLAKKARFVYGVEIVPQAVEDAGENAKRNRIDNVKFFTGAAEELLPKSHLPHPDVIVVDPPRKGCDYLCLDTMVKAGPERIVYVSCDPATLARDVNFLCDNGYRLSRVRPCDMFGNSYHVEVATLLERVRNAKEYI